MATFLTTDNVMFSLGILGMIFGVYNYFRKPQILGERRDALFAQQFEYMNKNFEDRFKAMQCNFDGLLTLNTNHVHTIDTKVENLTSTVGSMGNEVTKLATIIEERIPRK